MNDPESEDLVVRVLEERERSFHLEFDGKKAFFPKSQVVFVRRNARTGEAVVNLPLWLMDDRGW